MTTTFTLPMDIPNFEAAIRDAGGGSAEARLVAAIALGRIRDDNQSQAIATLGHLAHDSLEEVRAQALEGMSEQLRGGAKIPSQFIDQALVDPSPRVRSAAIESAILSDGDNASAKLIPMLGDGDPSVRATICQVLGEDGTGDAKEHLARLLDDPVTFVTQEAAMALAALGDGRGETILIELLGARNQNAVEAAYALGRIGKETACPRLRQIIQKTFVGIELKAMAAAALVNCGDEVGRPVLERLLHSPRRHTKHIALSTLARLPVKNMVAHVARLTNSSKPDIISAAIETLYFLAELDKEEVVAVLQSKRAALRGDLLTELNDRLQMLLGDNRA